MPNNLLLLRTGDYLLLRTGDRLVLQVGAAAYSLPADPGSLSVAGTAAGLAYGRTVTAETGQVNSTGTAAGLAYGRKVAASTDQFNVSGTDAGLAYGRTVTADSGSLAVSGTEANLFGPQAPFDPTLGRLTEISLIGTPGRRHVLAGPLAYQLEVDSGSYVVTGTDALLDTGVGVSDVAFLVCDF